MVNPQDALILVEKARDTGAILRVEEWALIEEYLQALIDLGIGEPKHLIERLERRKGDRELDKGGRRYG